MSGPIRPVLEPTPHQADGTPADVAVRSGDGRHARHTVLDPSRSGHGPWPVSPSGLAALLIAGLLGSAAAVAVTLASAAPGRETTAAAIIHGAVVIVPVALGMAALARRRDDRFALLLVAAGLLWSTTALAESSDAVLYSLGRLL